MKDIAITPEHLLKGYAAGIFPMAESREDPEIFWVDPKRRGILPLDGFHVSRSLARTIRRTQWDLKIDTCFDTVVDYCADRSDTWINPEIRNLYIDLHALGFAHSVEIFDGAHLVGGVYGVALGSAFFGESMFSRQPNASKMALAACIDHLKRGGFTLFDTQFITPHLASLGGIEIGRSQYHDMLRDALKTPATFHERPVSDLQGVVQRMTQTS